MATKKIKSTSKRSRGQKPKTTTKTKKGAQLKSKEVILPNIIVPYPVEHSPFTRNQLVQTLTKIGHGDLGLYVQPGLLAGKYEPQLLAHFISWQRTHGKVRDGKVAMPILALANVTRGDRDLIENAIAHLCTLNPRDLVRAWEFHSSLALGGIAKFSAGTFKDVREAIHQYLKYREQQPPYWERTILQHRGPMKSLYNLLKRQYGIGPVAKRVLFDGDVSKSRLLSAVSGLKNMSALEAAGVILKYKLPFEVIVGAASGAGWKVNSPEIVLALIEGMTGNQLVTNTKMLERMGVMKDPALKAAYNKALDRARGDKKMDALKAGRAAQAIEEQEQMRGGVEVVSKLKALQDHKVGQLKGIDGDWLVMGDKSGSMTQGIEIAKMVSSFLTSKVKGKVYLVFFDNAVTYFDATGKGYDEIQQMTRHIKPGGATFMGLPLDYISERGWSVNGIAVCSDGGETGGLGPGTTGGMYINGGPSFVQAYPKYVKKFGVEPTVYLFRVSGDPDRLSVQCGEHGIRVERFDCDQSTDYYSVQTMGELMRSSRYSLVDEIMETPLLTYKEVFMVKSKTEALDKVVGSWEIEGGE